MANTISPFGAQDFMHAGGSQRTEELAVAWIASSDPTPIFNGDIVSGVSPSGLLTGGVGQYVTQGSSIAAGPWRGVFRGCEFYNPTIQRMQFSRWWPGAGVAGTSSIAGDIKCFLITDPQQRFLMQGSSALLLGSSNIGMGGFPTMNGAAAGASSAVGNAATGQSGLGFGGTLVAAGPTMVAPFRLADFYSNWGAGANTVPGPGTPSAGAFVNGMDNTTPGQYVVVSPLFDGQFI